jgi:beta-glucosidase
VVFADDHAMTMTDGESPEVAVGKLDAEQETLIKRVAAAAHAAGKKVVVVLNTNAAVQMPWVHEVDAVLEMWYPGQEGGTATANILYGVTNPSGKLALSFPVSSAKTLFAGHPERAGGTQEAEAGETVKTIKWTEGLHMGYRWFTDPAANTQGYEPLFAFGHGLSYSTFTYSNLKVKPTHGGGVDVSFTITNTGTVAGDESAQVYVGPSSKLPSRIAQTKLRLAQFARVSLHPGKSERLSLHIDSSDLSSWDTTARAWVLGTGDRKLYVGAASNDFRLQSSVDVGTRR